MTLSSENLPRRSRLAVLLDHFATVEDPRDVRRILHPLPEILLLVVCGTIADCDDYEDIAAWGAAHLAFLRRFLPYDHGVPGERWLTILMNRINPALFAAAFEGWVRESWPERAGLVAIDGKTSRRSHDRASGAGPLHLVSAFATTARLVLAAEAVPDKAGELAAIPPLLERLGAEGGLEGALVSIDAIATNPAIAGAIAAQGADWLLAVKANQPTLRAEVEAAARMAEADVIVTITSAPAFSLPAAAVAPGTHLACMGTDTAGKQEVEPALLARARLFADEVAQSVTIGEAQHAVAAGVVTPADITPLGAVILGHAPGRQHADEITLFDGTGVALQDIAVAAVALARARVAGIGIEIAP